MVSIIIPTWNGAHLLQDNLPSVVDAAANHHPEDEIIVVDNGSVDGSVAWLNRRFPLVRALPLEDNTGFGYACNRGVTAARYDTVILLNNDTAVTPDFIAPLVRHFSDSRVFAVCAVSHGDDLRREKKPPDQVRHVLYASGGYVAYDKGKFLALGGFHPIYFPFYYEDRDLGYRAWKRGWKTLVDPESIVYHKGETTTGMMGRQFVRRTRFRNRFFFFLSCYDGPVTMMSPLATAVLQAVFSFRWHCLPELFRIWRERRKIAAKRKMDRPHWCFSDRKIARIISQAGGF